MFLLNTGLILNVIPCDVSISALAIILIFALWLSKYILWEQMLPILSCGTNSQAHVVHCCLFKGEFPILEYTSHEITYDSGVYSQHWNTVPGTEHMLSECIFNK